jgi:hypothetical protein
LERHNSSDEFVIAIEVFEESQPLLTLPQFAGEVVEYKGQELFLSEE